MHHYRTGLIAGHGTNQFKAMAYKYDLVSGKVNEVHYQPGMKDQFYHRYVYDAENRLTDVYTAERKAALGVPGREEHDARYSYYRHGPLGRTVVGDLQVQGFDYTYTIQGWMKGVNSDSLVDKDGMPGSIVPRDAYRFSLNYYNGDYSAIGDAVRSSVFAGHSAYLPTGEYRPLYNGNISSMVVGIPQLGETRLYNYGYDQLNRIVGMDAYTGYNPVTHSWGVLDNHNGEYRERVSYDANGNILTYNRNGTRVQPEMDKLQYGYNRDVNGNLVNNRLRHVKDEIVDGNYPDDLDNQPDDNYEYDAIGNLIKDRKEGLVNVEWNVYGKIKSISKDTNGDGTVDEIITYTYDVAGNRISKTVGNETTYYIRDGSGNVMSAYTVSQCLACAGGGGNEPLKQKEVHLYGSSRLGILKRDVDMDSPADLRNYTSQRGNKRYEGTNHLGNTLVVFTDRRLNIDRNGDGVVDNYEVEIANANDYYPFGMQMPGRVHRSLGEGGYRYGFNGKENDNEVKGEGNQQDYGMRISDPRVGRFLSVDPISRKYPDLTPYQFASNSPIDGIDLDGLEHIPNIPTFLAKISISISYIEFNGRRVASGSINLTRDNMSNATLYYLDNSPKTEGSFDCSRCTIATFKHKDYDDVELQIEEKLKQVTALRTPDMSDAEANSLKQAEPNLPQKPIKVPRIVKDLSSRKPVESDKPDPVQGTFRAGEGKGAGILAMVDVATDIALEILDGAVKRDIKNAKNQIPEAIKVINDIQFGLDNNLFDQTDLQSLGSFANYLLKGEHPISPDTQKTDFLLEKRFERLWHKISEKQFELENKKAMPKLP